MKAHKFILLIFHHASFSVDKPILCLTPHQMMQASETHNQAWMFYNYIHMDVSGLAMLSLIECDCPLTSFYSRKMGSISH